ncbi:MAG TPA: hypothetical protein VMJ32_10155 [Pirellulales bacterium]|nr:hypothetical protein [Pirellulales bacterium]
MFSKTKKSSSIAPTHTVPVPIGTPLYRALEIVAQAVAASLDQQQRKPTSPSDELPGATDDQSANCQLPHDR